MPRQRRESMSFGSNRSQSARSSNVRKRDRYVLHACDRCRVAKVRCNGTMPCSYCEQRDPESCHYTAPRFPQETNNRTELEYFLMTMMQRQDEKLDMVIERISGLEKRCGPDYTSFPVEDTPSWTKEPLPLLQNLTGALSTVRIMNAYLQANRQSSSAPNSSNENNTNHPPDFFSIIHGEILDESMNAVLEDSRRASFPVSASNPALGSEGGKNITRPLDQLEGTEIIRLIQLYQDLAGNLYPIVDVGQMEQQVQQVWSSSDAKGSPSSHLKRDELAILHTIIAIALAIEDENGSELLKSLHDSVWPDIEPMIWSMRVTANGLVVLALMCIFYYYSQKSRMALGLVDNITRIIIELGLNHHMVLNRSFTNQKTRLQVVNIIWTIFVLEHQVSYMLGSSVPIRNLCIDLNFPRPVEAPYLEAMIQYIQIGARACESLLDEKHHGQRMTSRKDAFSYFQYRLDEWRSEIETNFQFSLPGERTETWNQLLRTILHLRANNLQLVISQLLLFNREAQGAMPLDLWDSSVNIAADTSELLGAMDNSPKTYPFQKSQSNYFLIRALSMSFLTLSQNLSVPKSIYVANRSVPVSQSTYLKAEQTAVACLSLLYCRAETSRHAKWFWKRVGGLATQLNLLGSLVPSNNFTRDEDLASKMRTPDPDGLIPTQAEIMESLALSESSPLMDIDFSDFGRPTERSTSLTDLGSTRDMAFDTALGENRLG